MSMLERVKLINDAMKHFDSRYRLSVVLFKRAKMLNQGDQPLVKSKFVKEYFVALEELLNGKLEWKEPHGEWKKLK